MTRSDAGRAPSGGSWWPGALPVEALASAAVGAARSAVASLAQVRGSSASVDTSAALIASSFAAIDHLRIDGRPAAGWASYSGFFQARDGWVRLHGNYPHHAQAIERALRVSERSALEARIATLPAQEVEDLITYGGGVATVVRTVDAWRRHPHEQATADVPWCHVTSAPTRPRPPALEPGDASLRGIRVLDLTRVIAGPAATQLLACLGADVLRVDSPQRPELLDQYLSNAMGKRSASADLRRYADRVHDLIAEADVLLVGYRPGSLARFGLSPRGLCERHPRLIVASLSAWGEDGPWGARVGFDSIVQAATGIAALCARHDKPGALPVQALDHSTGYLLAAAIIESLAQGRAGVISAHLLGAARELIARHEQHRAGSGDGGRPEGAPAAPRTTADTPEPPSIITVDTASAHGALRLSPPPLTLDGQLLTAPVSEYGSAPLAWRDAPQLSPAP